MQQVPFLVMGPSVSRHAACVVVLLLGACGGTGQSDADHGSAGSSGAHADSGSAGSAGATGMTQGGSTASGGSGTGAAGGTSSPPEVPSIAGCALFPSRHLFNTSIAGMPVHASSLDFMKAVGSHRIHLDLGTTLDPKSTEYYGIPYNIVHSKAIAWQNAQFTSTDPDLSWNPRPEADCAVGSAHQRVSPCIASAAPAPQFPLPTTPLVEGGTVTDTTQPYGDHHILLLDADTCSLWELYHAYPDPKSGWDIFGAAYFDLKSTLLRPAGWTSADAAGFPILPLLLRADEASSGRINHALRFTIESNQIRNEYTWPARHLTSNGTSAASLPPMGQAFRIRASYVVPSNFNTQSQAIVEALKTYGMYLADGGSSMYIQGEPSAGWQSDTFDQVQSISSSEFEAVNLSPIMQRVGFDPNSAAVP